MAYSDFSLEKVQRAFGLKIIENVSLFADVAESQPSGLLTETLEYNTPLAVAINTEKSRSEMIISPILVELRKQLNSQISLFSGVDFSVSPSLGLTGTCDFLISRSFEQLFITAPVVTIVEAKNESIKSGLGQCVAEMIAAQLFNADRANDIRTIYGTVTTGQVWRFVKLEEQCVWIDKVDYYVSQLDKILGILVAVLRN